MTDISLDRVREIAAMDGQPVLRNLLITHGYHRLTLALVELFGRDNLGWPIFATWASKQAGVFIRKETLSATLRQLLGRPEHAPRRLRALAARLPHGDPALLHTADTLVEAIARYIVGGNTIVFEELGAAFAGFVATFAEPSARTRQNLAAFIERFVEGPSVPDTLHVSEDGTLVRSNEGGQSLIRSAMGHYFEALHERDANARAELILLANVECGLHEQIRLQPYIAGALDAPVEQLLRLACFDGRPHPLSDELAALVRRLSTELLMTMTLPDQVLRLGEDLPAPPGRPLWPAALERLEHSTLLDLAREVGAYDTREANLELHDRIEGWLNPLLVRLDWAEREAQGTGADDWAALSDRMRFVFELFRSRQCETSLLTPPFADEQLLELEAGRIPRGPL